MEGTRSKRKGREVRGRGGKWEEGTGTRDKITIKRQQNNRERSVAGSRGKRTTRQGPVDATRDKRSLEMDQEIRKSGDGSRDKRGWRWIDNCCLTPSQPRRSYQGDGTRD